MPKKAMRRAELIDGGFTIKQGEIFELGFRFFGYDSKVIIPTIDQTISVKIANDSGVVYETTASVDVDKVVFTVSENIGFGTMKVEMKVEEGTTLIQKYPADGFIELNITKSLDNVSVGQVYAVTAEQMRTEITAIETTAGTALTKAEGAETLSLDTQGQLDAVILRETDSDAMSRQAAINSEGVDELNLKVRLDKDYNKTISSLAEKLTQGTGAVTPADLSQETKEQMTGGSVAVVGVDTVLTENIVNKQVTVQKTDFATPGKNMFNVGETVSGKLDTTTGLVVADALWETSDFFPIAISTAYKRSHLASIVVYDASKNLLTSYSPNTIAITTGITVVYARTSIQVTNKNVYQLELGSATTTFEEFKVIYKGLKVAKEGLTGALKAEIDTFVDTTELTTTVKANDKLVKPSLQNYELLITQLLTASDPILPSSATVTNDLAVRWRNKEYGWRLNIASATIGVFRTTFTAVKTIPTVSAVGLWVYIEDATKVTNITLGLGTEPSVTTTRWSRDVAGLHYPLKNGWNLLRWAATSGDISFWGNFYIVRIAVTTNAATSVVIGSVFTESPPKAQVLFIEDGGYVEYLALGYPTLKSRGIPTTWALNPGRLGVGRVITETQIDELGLDPESEFSFHSWKSDVVANMTPAEIRADTIKSIRWIQKKGLQPKHIWRAAFTQNLATNHAAIQDLVEAYATYHGASGVNVFPFINPFNVGRRSIHGETVEGMDSVFANLQKTHGLYVCYTHGIDTGNPEDASAAQWAQFLQRIDEGIAGGWLEGVTYDMLRKRHEKQFGGYGFDHLIDAT